MSREINLDKDLEYKGYWYLPSLPDKKIAGVLTYYPNEKIVLELIGSFEDSIPDLIDNYGKKELIIYGDTSSAKDITLIQCFKSASINFAADFPIVTYTCRFMIIGKHINAWEEKCKYSVCVRIPELTYWCLPDALSTNTDSKQLSISFSTQFQNGRNIINEVQVNECTTIQIKKGVDYSSSDYLLKPILEQCTYVEIKKNKDVSIPELLNEIHLFEQFLSLATLGPIESNDITFYDEDIYQQIDERKYKKELQLIYPSTERKNITTNINRHQYLFLYSSIKDAFQAILEQWYNAPADLYPIRNHLIDSIKKPIRNSVDFLIIMQAVEGFWWRFRDDEYHKANSIPKKETTSLRTLLKELNAEFKEVDVIDKSEIDYNAIIDSRHYYSHFMPKEKRPKALDGWKLIEQAKILRNLLICCVLSFVGMDKPLINDILK